MLPVLPMLQGGHAFYYLVAEISVTLSRVLSGLAGIQGDGSVCGKSRVRPYAGQTLRRGFPQSGTNRYSCFGQLVWGKTLCGHG